MKCRGKRGSASLASDRGYDWRAIVDKDALPSNTTVPTEPVVTHFFPTVSAQSSAQSVLRGTNIRTKRTPTPTNSVNSVNSVNSLNAAVFIQVYNTAASIVIVIVFATYTSILRMSCSKQTSININPACLDTKAVANQTRINRLLEIE